MSAAEKNSVIEPQLKFDVFDRSEQDIWITVKGEDVLQFESNRQEKPASYEIALPDPVQAFVIAAQHGMFAHPLTEPWTSKAELVRKEVKLAERQQTWLVRLRNIDTGALLVLANMLQARVLDSVEIKSASSDEEGLSVPHFTSISALAFPRIVQQRSFIVDYEMPDRTSRERYLQITFKREADEFADEVYSALENWAKLLMLGGYPGPDMRPYQSAAVAEPAFLLDPNTIQLEFPDLFLCDEECFAAIVNCTRVIDHSICPVETLLIR